MRIATKFTGALLLGMLVAFGADFYFRVLRELSMFNSVALRDHAVMARVLAAAFRTVAKTQSVEQAIEFTGAVDQEKPWVRIALRGRDALAEQPAFGNLAPAQREEVLRGEVVSTIASMDGEPALVTYHLTEPAIGSPWVLELVESFSYPKAYVLESVWEVAVTTAGIVVMYAVMAVVLGYWIVGKPIRRLVDKAKRTGAGDLTRPLEVRGRDELAVLGAEINAMCDRLADAQGRLKDETAARMAALEQLRLADRLRTVGTLAAGVAHELGTPLNVVQARAQMIECGEVEEDEARSNAAIIVEESRRMAGIVRHLLDVARPRAPVTTKIEPGLAIERVLKLFAPIAERRGIGLRRIEGGEGLTVLADQSQLEQVIWNLVTNAIQAMPAGGTISIALGRERRSPPAGIGPEVDYVCLSVRDQGVGIPREQMARIFDPFFTTKEAGEGTGLGLWVCRGIAHELGGFIDVASTPGEGSCFSLYVPVASPA